MFVGHIVLVARALWRVLREDGTFWLNFGDSYSSTAPGTIVDAGLMTGKHINTDRYQRPQTPTGLKPKDLIGIPWRVAFALQADGWYLRSDIIWAKGVSFCPTYSGSCMPESVRDRPTKGHEYVFLLSKSKRYFYDGDAVRESYTEAGFKRQQSGRKTMWGRIVEGDHRDDRSRQDMKSYEADDLNPTGRNLRTVWTQEDRDAFAAYCQQYGVDFNTLLSGYLDGQRDIKDVFVINPGSYAGAHFATFSPALVEPMIKAGTSARGCCPECGAPWERVTEKEFIPQQDVSREKGIRGNGSQKTLDSTDGREGYPRGTTAVTTTGWTPTCSCYDWDHCAVCGAEMDDYDQEYGDHLDCGHNVCAECLISGEVADHVRECDLAPVPCTVLDPFLGSGTTAEVAIRLGRRAVGIELSRDYCDEHIIPRLEQPLQMEIAL
jgi:hypothetical protein